MFIQDSDNLADTSKELVYTLTMVEQLLYNNDDPSKDNSEMSEIDELKKTWISRFLKQGGLDKMIQMLEAVFKTLKRSQE